MPESSPLEEVISAELAEEATPQVDAAKFRQQMGQISRQSSVFFAGTIFTAASAYIFKVYLARLLGAEALGIYALGMTVVGLVSAFNGFGLPQAAVRFVASYSATNRPHSLGGFLMRSTLLLVVSNLVLAFALKASGRWIAVHAYHAPELGRYMGLFALLMVFGTFNVFFGQVLAGFKDVAKRTLITNFIVTPAMMVLTVLLITWGLGLWGYIFAQVATTAIATALLVGVTWRLTPKPARSLQLWSVPFDPKVVSFSLASLGMGFLQFLTAQTDKIFIGFYLNPRQVGIYAIAMGLVTFVPSVLQAVNQIFAPTIAELYAAHEHAVLKRLYQTLTKWIWGLTLPLILTILVFARPLMALFGHEFEAGWSSLSIATLGEIVDCGVGSVGFLLLMSGHEKRLLRIQAVLVVVIVFLNMALIPHWGIIGAAIGSAVATIATNLWCLREVYGSLKLFPYTRSYWRLVPPLSGSFVVVALGHRMLLSFRPVVVMAASLLLAYAAFAGIAVLWGLDADDRMIVEAVWARLRGTLPRLRWSDQ
jgi:O-antigen/teichoic acid export membrane protein